MDYRKRLVLVAMTLLLAVWLLGCAQDQPEPPTAQEQLTQEQLTQEQLLEKAYLSTRYLAEGEFQTFMELLSAAMAQAAGIDQWEATWDQLVAQMGEYKQTGMAQTSVEDGYQVVEHTLVFDNGTLVQRTVVDGEGLIAGLFFRAGEVTGEHQSGQLPEGLTAQSVQFQSQPGYPISATLVVPEGEIKAAIVLVHGSGPQDRDETIGPNKPFRDIAYGLAQQGIAVLRYDKVTYTHGAAMLAQADLARQTVQEETVLDAVNAVKWLKQQEGINPDQVFLLGHSLSGGLLSYADSLGADVRGLVSLAGTPRPLWQVQREQNELLLEEALTAGQTDEVAQARALLTQEVANAEAMHTWTQDELLNQTVFGLSAWYQNHLAQIDAIGLHMASQKPVLILQGGQDRQVTKKDYDAWKEGLARHPDATFHWYEQLNHLFGAYQGEPVAFSMLTTVEYMHSTPIAQQVIDDIASWILARSA